MFGSGLITTGLLRHAPSFLLQRLSTVLLGIVVGYCIVLLFYGPLPFMYGLVQIGLTVGIAWGLATAAANAIKWSTTFFLKMRNGNTSKNKNDSNNNNNNNINTTSKRSGDEREGKTRVESTMGMNGVHDTIHNSPSDCEDEELD
ncbi:uncharacterized protein TM35_000021570 [Trypanosoma theileri]|uniref:Uncharacterized protein n=1 Tax=Trypanosoma theileri TaxID=67003 RepID=A0A1X0P7L8_9TRYP|nr:uncharacterized protein TM35_000021570 [Trypanosoma theileri]ORC92831.1 hypothetical protein TM35_000021570 [Trypanosoma theileri]